MVDWASDAAGLMLRRIRSYDPGWRNPDDYTVHEGERTVGRVFCVDAAHPDGRAWMWTIEFHERRGEPPHQGHAATREDAMESFRRAWNAGQGKDFAWRVR